MIVNEASIPLTLRMFGVDFHSNEILGLSNNQRRVDGLAHNAGWFNAAGEKLGMGDLDAADFRRLMEALEDNEFFVVISEAALVDLERVQTLSSSHPGRDLPNNPGTLYVAQTALYIVGKGKVFVASMDSTLKTYEVAPGLVATCFGYTRQQRRPIQLLLYRAAEIAEMKTKAQTI